MIRQVFVLCLVMAVVYMVVAEDDLEDDPPECQISSDKICADPELREKCRVFCFENLLEYKDKFEHFLHRVSKIVKPIYEALKEEEDDDKK